MRTDAGLRREAKAAAALQGKSLEQFLIDALGPGSFHLHDLRHTANTLAAATGACTRELLYHTGHASPAAALRYRHVTRDRDAVIAQALGDVRSRLTCGVQRAGDGSRTRVTSLEGWCSAIELRPRGCPTTSLDGRPGGRTWLLIRAGAVLVLQGSFTQAVSRRWLVLTRRDVERAMDVR